MDLESLNGSMVGVDTRKRNVFTQVVAALATQETCSAGYTRLDGDAITYNFTPQVVSLVLPN